MHVRFIMHDLVLYIVTSNSIQISEKVSNIKLSHQFTKHAIQKLILSSTAFCKILLGRISSSYLTEL